MSYKQEYEGKDQISILSFKVGWEEFVVDLYDVKEILQAGNIRKLPKAQDYIDGIYNYRGEIIHIINLKKKLNLDEYVLYQSRYEKFEEESISKKKFIIIDQIISIDHVDPAEIVGLSPIFQTSVAMEFINGIIKFEDRPRIMLDLSKIFNEVELRIQQDLSSLT